MLKKILLFCLLLSVSLPETLWAWNQQSNEKVTDDISGYYVIRGNMDDEFFTIRSSAADEVFNNSIQSLLSPYSSRKEVEFAQYSLITICALAAIAVKTEKASS